MPGSHTIQLIVQSWTQFARYLQSPKLGNRKPREGLIFPQVYRLTQYISTVRFTIPFLRTPAS